MMIIPKYLDGFFLIFFLTGTLLFYNEFRPPQTEAGEERYVIPRGDISEEKIIDELAEKGFMRNKAIFVFLLDHFFGHGKMKPGAYLISKKMNAYVLAKTMTAGPYQTWVLIPPGKRKEQVAMILKKSFDWSETQVSEFIKIANEGYLFPDLYLLDNNLRPEQLVRRMENNFHDHIDTSLKKDLSAKDIRLDTAVKIASLVERESGSEEDKPIIAGIIWNRLLKKMKLEIDATVQYALASKNLEAIGGIPTDWFDFWPRLAPGIVRTIDSEYNTYFRYGLPPGPIASPGLSSIKAVVYPDETEDIYYLHSADKKIHTARDYAEHRENIRKYLEENLTF